MAAKRWRDLDPRVRKTIIGVGAAEAALKVAALVDMRRRPADQIRGRKRNWALAMIVNSAGLIPLCYFLFGRRHDRLRPALRRVRTLPEARARLSRFGLTGTAGRPDNVKPSGSR